MFYKDVEKKKKIVREYILKHPAATYRDLRKMGIKVDKVYPGKMAEAFDDASIEFPRTFKIKTKDEKRKIIIDYIKKHPKAGGHIIKKDTKINFLTVFKSTKAAFDAAKVFYPRKIDRRKREDKIKKMVEMIKNNQLVTIEEIRNKIKTKPYNFFKNIGEIYSKAGVKVVDRSKKRRLKKKLLIIDFIKRNPLVTQREINLACKTHVQSIFENGIFEAYQRAGVEFPYERLKLHGVALKDVKKRATTFEDLVALKLSGFGKVNRLVRTKRGVADVVFERMGKKAIVEIKDYQAKEISISQVRQLNRYLEDCDCDIGILICHKKPKRDRFLIDKNKIFIIEKSELSKIPFFMGL